MNGGTFSHDGRHTRPYWRWSYVGSLSWASTRDLLRFANSWESWSTRLGGTCVADLAADIWDSRPVEKSGTPEIDIPRQNVVANQCARLGKCEGIHECTRNWNRPWRLNQTRVTHIEPYATLSMNAGTVEMMYCTSKLIMYRVGWNGRHRHPEKLSSAISALC